MIDLFKLNKKINLLSSKTSCCTFKPVCKNLSLIKMKTVNVFSKTIHDLLFAESVEFFFVYNTNTLNILLIYLFIPKTPKKKLTYCLLFGKSMKSFLFVTQI